MPDTDTTLTWAEVKDLGLEEAPDDLGPAEQEQQQERTDERTKTEN